MVKAMVIWVKPEDGGKKMIPTIELPFYPMIKINDDNKMIDWSLCLTNKQFISEYETISEIGFLMGNAPHHLLKSGVKFKLFEGAKEVASGEIM